MHDLDTCLELINTYSIIIFSTSFCLNLDKHFDFLHNYRVLHKTLSQPYDRRLRDPDFGRDLGLGTTGFEHWDEGFFGMWRGVVW